MATLYGADTARGSVWKLSIPADSFSLGCSPRAGVPVADRSLAAHELVVARRGDAYTVRALESSSGLRLNERPLEPEAETPLADGDFLHGGHTIIVFYRGEVEPPVALRRLREAQRRALPRSPAREPPRRASLVVLALALLLGVAVGFAVTRFVLSNRDQRLTRDLDRLVEELDLGADAGEDELGRSLEELAGADLGGGDDAAPEASGSGAPEPVEELAADSPETSRRRLHRLAIDLLGRPPTREEEASWLPLSHAERWEALFDPSRLPPREAAGDRIAAVFRHFVAVAPGPDDLAELTPLVADLDERELWDRVGRRLAASERYGSREFRRTRARDVLGRSLIVDLLDRAPRSDEEAELVVRAFEEAPLAAARTLVHAAAPRAGAVKLRAEFLRFAGRSPELAEADELERVLEEVPPEDAARWLPVALALLEDYAWY